MFGSVRPVTVVADDGDIVALYLARRARIMWPGPDIRSDAIRKLVNGEWSISEFEWVDNDVLILLRPGDAYSPQLYLPSNGSEKFWYVNPQAPVQRTTIGFDTRDHIIDVVVAHDLSSWFLKDTDELEEAVALGFVTEEQADEFRATVTHVTELIDRRDAWWSDWGDWSPDPSWPIPSLPEGWDEL